MFRGSLSLLMAVDHWFRQKKRHENSNFKFNRYRMTTNVYNAQL